MRRNAVTLLSLVSIAALSAGCGSRPSATTSASVAQAADDDLDRTVRHLFGGFDGACSADDSVTFDLQPTGSAGMPTALRPGQVAALRVNVEADALPDPDWILCGAVLTGAFRVDGPRPADLAVSVRRGVGLVRLPALTGEPGVETKYAPFGRCDDRGCIHRSGLLQRMIVASRIAGSTWRFELSVPRPETDHDDWDSDENDENDEQTTIAITTPRLTIVTRRP
jgi:hypothetical protein